MIKTAISTYSFQKLIASKEMTMFDVIEKTKELGVDGIEFAFFDAPEGEDKVAFAHKLGEACRKAELPVINYAIGANFTADSNAVEAEVERLNGELEIAKALGAPLMRHDVTSGFPKGFEGVQSYETILPFLVEGCLKTTENAQKLNIRTCVENHGYYFQGAERVERLVGAVNHRNFGLLVDIGNFICADEDGAVCLGKLLPLAFHVHVKDMFYRNGERPKPGAGWGLTRSGNYFRPTVLGHGDTPVVPSLLALKRSGYEGYVSLEFEGVEPTLWAIETSIANLKLYLQD